MDTLGNAKKYVVTSRAEELQWRNSVKISGDIPIEIAKLKADEGPLLQVHGSWELIQLLLAHSLVDEFRLWTFPVIAYAQLLPSSVLDHPTYESRVNLWRNVLGSSRWPVFVAETERELMSTVLVTSSECEYPRIRI